MKGFDERQILIRGKIVVQALVLVLIMMLAAAFINDFHIFDIEKEIGFSDFMIGTSYLLLGFVSCSILMITSITCCLWYPHKEWK